MGYRNALIITILFFLTLLSSCKKPRVFDRNGYEKIIRLFPEFENKTLVISYFDGDCSFCIAKIIQIEKEMKTDGTKKAIFIASTNNPDALLWNVKAAKIPLSLILDTISEFKSILKLNETIIIDRNREIKKTDSFSD